MSECLKEEEEEEENILGPNDQLMESARYGEPTEMRAALEAGADANYTDGGGNTALHRAAANGEVECLTVLKEYHAAYIANRSGNYPLHWAAMNQQLEAVRFLLREFEVDVLAQNRFGRSALTEAFATENTDVLQLLLGHSSASEELLQQLPSSKEPLDTTPHGLVITGDEEAQGDENDSTETGEQESVEHCFSFTPETTIAIRELPIARADNPFGAQASEDSTGMSVWPASLLLAQWCVQQRGFFNGRVVHELGAGCGVPGVCVAALTQATTVYLSDVSPVTLLNLQHNISLNRDKLVSCVHVRQIDWSREETWPDERADVVIGADLVYSADVVPLLAAAVAGLLCPSGHFLYVAPTEGRDGLDMLQATLAEHGVHCVSAENAPEEMFRNPLASADEQSFLMYFVDLVARVPHVLYTFQRQEAPSEL